MTTTISNAGKWDRWYSLVGDEAAAYGDTPSYKLAAKHVARCQTVEDWGCGKGWLRQFIKPERYVGIDGSSSPFADMVADLTVYRSEVAGIVIRHVLEHDYRWHLILENALQSARERVALVLYTPMSTYTRQIDFEDDPGVPVLSFRLEDLTGRFDDHGFEISVVELDDVPTNYRHETIILGTR